MPIPTLAHLLIGFYFVFFGVWNIYHWIPVMMKLLKERVPHPYFLMLIGIMLQIGAGCMIMLNTLSQFAALFLLPFTLIYLCVFHPYWNYQGEVRRLHFNIFVTNLTVTLGALFCLI